jgi:hypothetical protein
LQKTLCGRPYRKVIEKTSGSSRPNEASLSSAIEAGFILNADRQEMLQLAAIAYRGSY